MKTRLFFVLLAVLYVQTVSVSVLFAQQANNNSYSNNKDVKNQPSFPLHPEFLWSGAWESRHNIVDRFDVKLAVPKAKLALRLEVLDRRPASSAAVFRESFGGETADKAITQGGLGLYHLSTGSRLLYGVLDTYGLPARVRNVWIRGAPYAQSREESGAELKTAPSASAVPMGYAHLETSGISAGDGLFRGFVSLSAFDDKDNRAPSVNAKLGYEINKMRLALEGYYTERALPLRKSSTWFNEKPALPARDTRLFAGSASVYLPSFALAADLSYSQTFAFGSDHYGSLGLRFGDKPWRFSLAFDAAGSRYIDSSGSNPGAGFRSAARLERIGKKTGLLRLNAVFRGPGPDDGLVPSLGDWNFSALVQSFNRMSGELYYRVPANNNSFGITRFSFSADRDERNIKKVLDSGSVMAAFKLGPVNYVSDGKIVWFNHNKSSGTGEDRAKFDSCKLTQNLSWTVHGSFSRKTSQTEQSGTLPGSSGSGERKKTSAAKKGVFTVQLSARAGYEKTIKKEGIWDTSFSASFRTKKQRITVKAASLTFPKKWEFTVSWRLLF